MILLKDKESPSSFLSYSTCHFCNTLRERTFAKTNPLWRRSMFGAGNATREVWALYKVRSLRISELPCDRTFLHYSSYFSWNKFRRYITFSLPQKCFGWNHSALHDIILTTTLNLHLFFVSLHYIKNSGTTLILRCVTLGLHQELFSEFKM